MCPYVFAVKVEKGPDQPDPVYAEVEPERQFKMKMNIAEGPAVVGGGEFQMRDNVAYGFKNTAGH